MSLVFCKVKSGVSTSETSVIVCGTRRRKIPEDSHLQEGEKEMKRKKWTQEKINKW
jgi:hypothetical protein